MFPFPFLLQLMVSQETTQRYGKVTFIIEEASTSEKEPQLHVSTDVPPAECGMRISNVPASVLVQSHRSHQCQPSARQALPNLSLWQPFTVWSFQPSIGMPVGTIGTGKSIQNTATVLNGNDSIQASPMPLSDLFQMEMGRIQQAKEQAIQIQEDKKSQLKAEYEKERDEMCKKYDMLLQHYEMVLAQKEKDFGTHYKKLYVNKLLAETFRQGYEGDKVGLFGTQEANVPGFMNEITLSSAICCEE